MAGTMINLPIQCVLIGQVNHPFLTLIKLLIKALS